MLFETCFYVDYSKLCTNILTTKTFFVIQCYIHVRDDGEEKKNWERNEITNILLRSNGLMLMLMLLLVFMHKERKKKDWIRTATKVFMQKKKKCDSLSVVGHSFAKKNIYVYLWHRFYVLNLETSHNISLSVIKWIDCLCGWYSNMYIYQTECDESDRP